ncbi:hypothetical protein [Streptomyces sp. NPDC001250]|uniref:hypothetical protein n=1 Tax=unclassified Streptomyces TaxID=2593676 RepID=UPI00332CD333
MILDINALQALEGEDAAGLADCWFTCGQTDGQIGKLLSTSAKPPFTFTVDITGSNGSLIGTVKVG